MQLSFDISAAQKRIGGMLQKIEHFKSVDIGAELSAWQTEDMHRKRPFTMRSRRAGKAATTVRPHSLYEMKRSSLYQRRMARRILRSGKRAFRNFARWEPLTSTRPILRQTLDSQLTQRMSERLREKLKW